MGPWVLTIAKLSEAEALAAAGFRNFFVCYPLIGRAKLRRLRALSREAAVMTVVESKVGARGLSAAMSGEKLPLDVVIKVDVGMHRVGVPAERASDLADLVGKLPGLRLRGVCIHEGSTYAEPDPDRRAEIAREQAGRLARVASQLRDDGQDIDVVSSGATPGAASLEVEGLTEFRPGNYVFYDAMQTALGVVESKRCALSVVSTVVSHAAPDRAIIDAGSKTLSSDRGAHGTGLLDGYGVVNDRPGATIHNLSEEHGWLRLEEGTSVQLGERLEVVPNHACPVADNFSWAAMTRKNELVARWTVDARGCLT